MDEIRDKFPGIFTSIYLMYSVWFLSPYPLYGNHIGIPSGPDMPASSMRSQCMYITIYDIYYIYSNTSRMLLKIYCLSGLSIHYYLPLKHICIFIKTYTENLHTV